MEVVFPTKEEEKQSEKMRVLCWVMTGPENHQAKVRQAVILDS